MPIESHAKILVVEDDATVRNLVLTALEMDRRGAGHWVAQLVGALAVLAVSFAGLFGLAGSTGMLALAALQLYIAGWGFVCASVSLSVRASGVAAA